LSVELQLALYASQLRAEDFPDMAVEAFYRLLLDTSGVMLAGNRDPECRRIANSALAWGGSQLCSVVNRREKVPPPVAAFINGVYAHWCEWDDTHDDSHVHGSAVIFPALFAAAEAAGIDEGTGSGRQFIAAVVAAFDIACRVGGLLKPYSHRGWMPTGSGGAVGAAAAAARLLGLDTEGILSAMGIAAAGSGLFRQALADKTNGKSILAGITAKNAIEAAFLARAGVIGAPNFLTGQYGLKAIYANGHGDAQAIIDDLNRRFCITEMSIKPYPCCRTNHPAIDLILDLLKEYPQAAEQVDSIHLIVPEGEYERCGAPFSPGENPRVSAQFSIPFTVALALRHGKICPEDFDPQAILSDAAGIADIVPRVTVEPWFLPPGADDVCVPVTVQFRLSDNRQIEKVAHCLKGSPERPLTPAEEREKLIIATADTFPYQQVDALTVAVKSVLRDGPSSVLSELCREREYMYKYAKE